VPRRKLKIWSDSAHRREPVFTKDQVLTDVMIYLATDTIDSSIWFYRGRRNRKPLVVGIALPGTVPNCSHSSVRSRENYRRSRAISSHSRQAGPL
jgi:hypothetical protein